jgi:membrane protein
MATSNIENLEAQWVRRPSGFSRSQLWSALKRTYGDLSDMDTSLRCAGVAFFGFLSVFPAIAVGVALYALFAEASTLQDHLTILSGFVPGDVMTIIEERLEKLTSEPQTVGIGLIISLGLALWSGSRGMNALIHALSKSQKEEDNRGFFSGAIVSLSFTIGGFFIMALIFFTVAVLPTLAALIAFAPGLENLVLLLRWPIIAAIVFAAVIVLYKKAPHRSDPRLRWIIPGALLGTLLWLIGSVAFSFYIENFGNYDATFGTIATAVVMMMYLYISATVFVLGALLNAQLEYETAADTTVGSVDPMGKRGAVVADNLPPNNA